MSEQEHKPIAERLNDLPQWVLRVGWCIFWLLNKLIQFKPAWYVWRAILSPIVGVFGWTVGGIPGKELWIDITPKKLKKQLEEFSLLICECGHARTFHADEQPHECWYHYNGATFRCECRAFILH